MQSHIQKWGNSLGLRIPMQLAKKLHLKVGSVVTLEVEDSRIIIQFLKYNLDTMLEEITQVNCHHSLLEDSSKGNEE